MSEDIVQRVVSVCNYVVESGCTVREAAEVYGISKSTVHKDCTERIRDIDCALAERVREVLEHNLAVRHLRGGEATRRKFRRENAAPTAGKTV